MTENSRVPEGVAMLSILLVGLNVLGLFWMSASVSRMASTLESVAAVDNAAHSGSTNNGSGALDAPVDDFVNVAPRAGLKVPGVIEPNLCSPDQVDLAGNELVIGVEVNGQSRAYVVEAFEVHEVNTPADLSAHVVNDVMGGTPVSITHCDRTHSTRVLTYPREAGRSVEPLDVCVGGWDNGMVLIVGDATYPHHDQQVPLVDLPFLTTTWSQWREQHPDSLVYTGEPCES